MENSRTPGPIDEQFKARMDQVIRNSQKYMLHIQKNGRFWWGELESNPTMESEYLMLTYFLGVEDWTRWRKISKYILSKQQKDGSWVQYYDAPGDLSTSVECYAALKLAGIPEDSQCMIRARDFILSKGGVPKARIFTKIWLALIGEYSWNDIPNMLPELILLPTWFPFNIYAFSSWARATIVPMTIILTEKPVKPVPLHASIRELYPKQDEGGYPIPKPTQLVPNWHNLFLGIDKLIHILQKLSIRFSPL